MYSKQEKKKRDIFIYFNIDWLQAPKFKKKKAPKNHLKLQQPVCAEAKPRETSKRTGRLKATSINAGQNQSNTEPCCNLKISNSNSFNRQALWGTLKLIFVWSVSSFFSALNWSNVKKQRRTWFCSVWRPWMAIVFKKNKRQETGSDSASFCVLKAKTEQSGLEIQSHA